MHVHHLKCQILFWVRSKWSLLQFSPFLTSLASQGHNNSRYGSRSPQTNFSSEYHKIYIFWLQKSLLDCVFDVGQIVQTFLKIAGFWPIFGLFLTICYYYGSKIGPSINFKVFPFISIEKEWFLEKKPDSFRVKLWFGQFWPNLAQIWPNLASRRLGMVMYGVFTINGHSPTPKWGQRNFTGNQAGISQSSCVKFGISAHSEKNQGT